MRRFNKKAVDTEYVFITLVLVLLIVIALILLNSGAFGKTKKFVTSCVSANPVFEYKCANDISKDNPGQTSCPYPEWSVDRSKECEEGIQCCFRER